MLRSDDREFWQGANRAAEAVLASVVGVAGLFAAAGPNDPIRTLLGLGIFAVAVAVLGIGVKRHFDGAPPLSLADLVIDDFAALAIGLPLLTMLGIGGLALAAASGRDDLAALGYGLAGAALVLAGLGLKACCDRAEFRD